ncbi:M1 family metallopeptidase [Pleomorphovibrio marinus]|uniref:M1 family metallopeptidase n=1 Tax=Pleomorphovibrio marinus TaxID=2164132 RepID=UPI000E0ABD9B|nr:M1 family metallopeptidase [Pleomorphovibrio marinus]
MRKLLCLLVITGSMCTFHACKTTQPVTEPTEETPTQEPESEIPELQDESKELVREKERKLREYQASRERKFDLLHSSLDLSFDFERQQVEGKALLKVKPYFFPQKELALDAKDFEIHDVWLEREEGRGALAFRYDQEKVSIFLPETFSSSDTLEIGLSYTAKPEEGGRGGSKAITDAKGLYFINPMGKEDKPTQIWTQGETEHNSKWYPTIDSPNERHTHDIKLRVEDRYITLSNGQLQKQTQHEDGTRTDHWLMDMPHAPYLAALVVGEFDRVEDEWEGMPVHYYVEKGYAEGAKKVFGDTPEMIGFFSDLLGVKYPWQRYDQVVVRDFVSGAMENTTLSIFMESLNLDEREAIDSEWDYIIAHELFHQWFGNLVTNESWSHLPLNESFADYSEYLWFEYKQGKDVADLHNHTAREQYLYEAQEKKEDLIRFFFEDAEDMFDSHSYAKGGRVLHMLRRHLGDEAFFGSLNHYLTKHAFSSVEIHDLRLAFEEVTGQDLNWFFNQWFLGAGHPLLEVNMDYSVPDNVLLTVSQQQDLVDTPLYRLPFTVSIYKGGVREEKSFVLEQGTQYFALENGDGTELILFDERMDLLAERETYRGKEMLTKQLRMSESGLARLEALDSLTSDHAEQGDWLQDLKASLNDSFHEVRGLAISRIGQVFDSETVSDELEGKLVEMAKTDESNEVRAAAIDLLAKTNGERHMGLFEELIEEASYVVEGAALMGIMDQPGNLSLKRELLDRLEEESNIRVVVPLADFMTNEQLSDRSGWFHRKLDQLSGENLYYFIGYYGDYFSSVPGTEKEKALENLLNLAADHKANYIRLTAFQSLFGFIDEGDVLQRVIEIHANEEDEMVRNYQGFFLEPYLEEN